MFPDVSFTVDALMAPLLFCSLMFLSPFCIVMASLLAWYLVSFCALMDVLLSSSLVFLLSHWCTDRPIACLFPYASFPDGELMAIFACLFPDVFFHCSCTDGSITCQFTEVPFTVGALIAPLLSCSLMYLTLLVHW